MAELSKEEISILRQDAVDGQKLYDLVCHPGWKDVLKPRFASMREGMIQQFLSESLDLAGFQLVQQSVNALDAILKGIDFAIDKGNDAEEKLKGVTDAEM